MNQNEIEECFKRLFTCWGGMADDDAFYTNVDNYDIDLNSDSAIRRVFINDLAPYFKQIFARQYIEQTRFFLKYAFQHPDEINIRRLFQNMLITVAPPADNRKFFRILLEEFDSKFTHKNSL